MEARLKEDILSEVRQSGSRMLLHREEYSPALNQSSVIGYLESIFADDVKTPAEVYAALKDEDYNFAYRRIPLTREREALSSDVDAIQYCIDECAGAGHPRDGILYYSKELKKFPDAEDEQRAYLMDMGIKALRRYFFLITFRSYLYCTSAADIKFTSWMYARPELGHLCNNLRVDK